MGYGFVFAYGLTLLLGNVLFPIALPQIQPLTIIFVIVGLLGGAFPDVDRWQVDGLIHRKTFHYVLGYGFLAIATILIYYFDPFSIWILGFSCFFASAWLHSFMDIFDGFWEDDPNKGVYEHITRKWIRALNWVPFGSLWEWSLQWLSSVSVIAISPQLPAALSLPGWAIATSSFFGIWLMATFWEFTRTVPKRREMEIRALEKMRN